MTHTDKALKEHMEQVTELSLTLQEYMVEGQIDLGKRELVVHALLDKIQDVCNDWIVTQSQPKRE